MSIAEMVLVGKINPEIVMLLNFYGAQAVGLSGKDAKLIRAKKSYVTRVVDGETRVCDIGYVGDVEAVNPEILAVLSQQGYIPVIAPIGVGEDLASYNINADSVAGAVAGALKADKLILLTDVEGIFANPRDPATLISTLKAGDVAELIACGAIDGGMIPKVRACVAALEEGVNKTHIIDGRVPHALLLEIFTDRGIGTEVVK